VLSSKIIVFSWVFAGFPLSLENQIPGPAPFRFRVAAKERFLFFPQALGFFPAAEHFSQSS